MKFEKTLKAEAVSEWRIKYIDYKSLKGKLQRVQRVKLAREKEWTHGNHRRSVTSFNDTASQTEIMSMSSQKNYNNKRFPFQSQQKPYGINIPEHKSSKNNDRRFSIQSQPRTFSMGSMASMADSFFHRVSTALVSIQKQQNPSDRIPPPDQITSLDTLMDQVYPEECTFFVELDNELKKIEKFYGEKEKQALDRIDDLEQQYKILKDKKLRDNAFKSFSKQEFDYLMPSNRQGNDYESTIIPEQDILELPENQLIGYKFAKKLIKKAVFEFYRSLELIRKYKSLNYTGFVKILKKYDKISGRNGTKTYMPKVENSHFVKSNTIKKLLKDAEDFYVNHFEGGSRSQALRQLQLPNRHDKTYYSSMLRVGLYLGLATPPLIYCIAAKTSDYPMSTALYSAIFLPIVFLLLIGINMYVWTRSHINYKFIFEFNPRDNLDFRQYLELPSIILLVLSYIMILHFHELLLPHIEPLSYMHQHSYHIILVIFIGVAVFNPFPIFYYSSRRWFILSVARLFGSGILRVEFRDFFIADGLTSLSYSLSSIVLFGCIGEDVQDCGMELRIYVSILASIPALFRLLQCYKRYRDTLQINHLINIAKYGIVIVATWMSLYYKRALYYKDPDNSLTFLVLWVIAQSIASVYTFFWDIKMDWSLFNLRSVNYLLRNELGYKYHWLYYIAIISNFFLRWSWIFIELFPYKKTAFLVSFGEIIRRWLWNFFRVENEHSNNCVKCRAVKEHILPFKTQTDEIRDFETIIPDDVIEVNNSDYDRTPSFSSWSRRLFTTHSIYKRRSDPSNNWKDFETRKDATEYIYPDDIYEVSDESFDEEEPDDLYTEESKGISAVRGHGLSNTYASRRFPPM